MHIKNFEYSTLLRKYRQLNMPMSAGEKTGPYFLANYHVLNFYKYHQSGKW